RVFGDLAGSIRPADLHRAYIGEVHVHLIVRNHAPALHRLREAFLREHLPNESHPDNVWARLYWNAQFEARVSGQLHVRFPLRITGKPRLAIACVTGRGRASLRLAADGEALHEFAV